MTFCTGLNYSRFIWLFNKVKSNIEILHKKLSLEDHMLVVLMKLKLGLLNKDLAVRFDISTSGMSKIFRSLVPLFAAHMQGLIQKEKVDVDGEKGAQISSVVKKIVTQGDLKL